MNTIWRILLFVFKAYVKGQVVNEVRRRGTLAYLKTVNATRLILIGALLSFIFLQMMVISLIGVIVTGFFLWEHEFQAKLEILFWIFLGMFTLPALLLIVGLSERLWYRVSGAKKMVDDLARQ